MDAEQSVPTYGSKSEHFSVSFIRENDDRNDVSASELGIALLGISKIFDRANQLIYGDEQLVSVRIDTHSAGSFTSHCILISELADTAQMALSGDFDTAATNLKGVVFGEEGIIEVLKSIGRNRARVATTRESSEIVDLVESDAIEQEPEIGIFIENERGRVAVGRQTVKLLEDPGIREGVNDLISPLMSGETDKIDVLEKGRLINSIDKREARYITQAKDDESTSTEIETMDLILATVSFVGSRVWYLKNGGGKTESYHMRDEEFLLSVKQGRDFRNGDVLNCVVLTTTTAEGQRTQTTREIVKVNSHLRQREFEI